VIAADRLEGSLPSAPALPPTARLVCEHTGIATYRLLAGCEPVDADIADDHDFDRHVLASILAAAAMEGVAVAAQVGLAPDELATLVTACFPLARDRLAAWCAPASAPEDDEVAMVRDLLLAQRSSEGDVGRWLAAMIARRAMEPNHLWEDLGLRERAELSRMLTRHFAPLAARNTRNMRWKRFFYRMLCEDDGFVMCTTPVCTQCNDFDLCFGEESGESRMAERRREFLLQAGSLSPQYVQER
jgi:nitrogen fixation protein NifQ